MTFHDSTFRVPKGSQLCQDEDFGKICRLHMMTSDNVSNFLTHMTIFQDHVMTGVMTGEDLLMTLSTLGEDLLVTLTTIG